MRSARRSSSTSSSETISYWTSWRRPEPRNELDVTRDPICYRLRSDSYLFPWRDLSVMDLWMTEAIPEISQSHLHVFTCYGCTLPLSLPIISFSTIFKNINVKNIYIWIITILCKSIWINNWLRLAECWQGPLDLDRKWKAWHNIQLLLVLVGICAISVSAVLWASPDANIASPPRQETQNTLNTPEAVHKWYVIK